MRKGLCRFLSLRTFMALLFTLRIFNLPGIYFYLLCKTAIKLIPHLSIQQSRLPLQIWNATLYLRVFPNFLWQTALILSWPCLEGGSLKLSLSFKMGEIWACADAEGALRQWRTGGEGVRLAIRDRSKGANRPVCLGRETCALNFSRLVFIFFPPV